MQKKIMLDVYILFPKLCRTVYKYVKRILPARYLLIPNVQTLNFRKQAPLRLSLTNTTYLLALISNPPIASSRAFRL